MVDSGFSVLVEASKRFCNDKNAQATHFMSQKNTFFPINRSERSISKTYGLKEIAGCIAIFRFNQCTVFTIPVARNHPLGS